MKSLTEYPSQYFTGTLHDL